MVFLNWLTGVFPRHSRSLVVVEISLRGGAGR